ncbi:CBS domain-containing protein [Trichlorobacter ammonificans]|uniref:tRNA nucleotidyltransferase, A-adding n=1 Tax=Trichlorobacter ammonificans TaxID=2916410 RepID=A0ABN8HKG2_9BACT|nr:CBS domain-containing protein [Trichlorobacter ammonificans]CAH2030432.1 tRNA nucleotidyltransferase, A-adding [Trichlorobacter ammonificans]
MDLVVTHLNADFDCLGSLVAASRLYPEAQLCFPGSLEKNLREFCAAHPELLPPLVRAKEVELSAVSRLIMVDCQHPSRIGRFADLVGRSGVTLHIYDHHPRTGDSPVADGGEIRPCGATTTILCSLLQQQGGVPTPAEATLMLLAIHEDTGHLSFGTTTPEDYTVSAWLLGCGGQLALLDEALAPELTTPQVELLHDLLASLKTTEVAGVRLSVAYASRSWYVGDVASLAHMMLDMENLDVLVLVLAMGDRVFLVGRSRVPEVDVGELLRKFGGGGHGSAASATVREQTLTQVLERLDQLLLLAVRPRKSVGQIMSSPVKTIDRTASVAEAREWMVRYNYSAMPVVQDGEVLGIITRKVAEKSVYHGLGTVAVTDLMHTVFPQAVEDTPLDGLIEQMIGGDSRFVPVFRQGELVGVVTRTDLLRHLHGSGTRRTETLYDLEALTPEPSEREIVHHVNRRLPEATVALLRELGRTGERLGMAVYGVGGFVRDLLLDIDNQDVDITVEGDGILFAETFARQHGCRVRSHQAFGTAVLVLPTGGKLDIASTRLEFYESPGVLPTVERSSLRRDLHRRDFTINTLALCLNPDRFGRLIDHYGGQKDLREKMVRVLHNLSFVEDPTRCFRAVRFEQRLGFHLEPHTEGLLRTAVRMGLVERVGGKRLLGELTSILREREPLPAVRRMAALGLLPFIHAELRFGDDVEHLFAESERALAWYELLYLPTPVEAWAVYFLALTDRLDSPKYRETCTRLAMPGRWLQRLFGHRHRAIKHFQALRQGLRGGVSIANSRVYALLRNIPIELLLYGLARSGQEELRRLVSHYLVRLAHVTLLSTGADLHDIGVPPGPSFGRIKERLLAARLDGEVRSRDDELEFARRLLKDGV